MTMPNNTLVSIIVPVYKVEKYLDECVSSLVMQTYQNLEIILVNDGSPDNCPAMCDAWQMRDGRIKVVHKTNGGVSDARNAGIRIATGDWLLFVDADDIVPVGLVEALASARVDDKILVISGVERFSGKVHGNAGNCETVRYCGKDLISKRGGMYCWGALYSRVLVNKLELQFDTTLRNIEDVVWNGIYLRYIADVVYVDIPYYYRINPTSITSRCSDYKWQVASWIAARRSIMDWFKNKQLTREQCKEVRGIYRHCQNNIHAECVAGNISYAELHVMEKDPSALFDQTLVPAIESFVQNHFPKLYYRIYTFLIRMKNAVHK